MTKEYGKFGVDTKAKRLYTETSVEDIVGLVKTDEPTNSVQLKKEAQLSICEKRLIELLKENEQLKQQLENKEIEWLRDNTVWEQMPTTKKSTTIANDFNQSNCITVQKARIKELKKENEQLKQELFETSKELLWATSDEVDRVLHYEDEVEDLRKEIFE